jgi:hypothetical protein
LLTFRGVCGLIDARIGLAGESFQKFYRKQVSDGPSHSRQNMTPETILGNIISGVVGGIAVSLVSHFLTKDRERRRDIEARKQIIDAGIASRKRDLIGFLAGWQSEFERAQIPYEITQTFDERAKHLRVLTAVMKQDCRDGHKQAEFDRLVTAITDFPLNHVSAPDGKKRLFESIGALERFTMES